MNFLDSVRGKLGQANEALADAHKEWRDERLNARESELERRESAISAREAEAAALVAEARASDARWFRRKVRFTLGLVVGSLPALILGVAIGRGGGAIIPEEGQSMSSVIKAPLASSEEPLSDDREPGGSSEAVEAVSDSAVESTSSSMSFDDCISQIHQFSDQLAIAPTNIVETSVLRVVRFPASDGSVLVSCSQPDQKMVITRSPYR